MTTMTAIEVDARTEGATLPEPGRQNGLRIEVDAEGNEYVLSPIDGALARLRLLVDSTVRDA